MIMDAPFYELVIRLATAIVATVAFYFLVRTWRHPRMPARPLMRFLTVVVGMVMVTRWTIFFLGTVDNVFGMDQARYNKELEPFIRSFTTSLLFLLLFAVALVAYYHNKQIKHIEEAAARWKSDG